MTLQAKFFAFVAPVLLATAAVPPALWYARQANPVPAQLVCGGVLLCAGLIVTALLTVRTSKSLLVANSELERHVSDRTRELAGRNAELVLAEEKFRSIFENATEGIFQTRPAGRPLAANPAMVQMLGYDSETDLLSVVTDLGSQVYADPTAREGILRLLLRDGHVDQLEAEFVRRDKTRILVSITAQVVRDSNGNLRHLQCFVRDITQSMLDQRRAESLEQDRRAVLEMIARDEPLPRTLEALCRAAERQWEQVRAMVLLNDGTHQVVAAAPKLSAGFVLRIDNLLGSNPSGDPSTFGTTAAFVPDISADPRWVELHQPASDEGVLACNQVPIVAGSGKPLGSLVLFFEKCVSVDEHDFKAMQSLSGLCGMAIEHHQLIARLEHDAVHDPVTGLANRAQLDLQLPKWINAAGRHGRSLALMMIDLDGFKNVNDTLGHRSGDLLLRQVAARLADAIRDSDVLVRMGGDEFTLVATEIHSAADISAVADRLIRALADPFVVEGRELFVTASIGMAVYPNDGMDGPGLQRCADSAMYAAKAGGRNRALRFDPTMGEAALDRLEMEGQLRRAISQNEFMLEYQPQVNLRGEMVGVEALVRWQHPQLGRIAPTKFIPLAEQCGLVVPIGSWVLGEACRQAMAWQKSGCTPLPVAVNVSALQFQQEDFLEILKTTLDTTGLPPAYLELELTESLLLANTADAIRKVAAVRELGVGVAIDDFGTGYSSLAYLQKLPIDRLKIDQSFVHDMGTGPNITVDRAHTAVITAITSLAASLGMQVVAEGVETTAQRDYLIELGCDALQGFLFSRPVHAERIEAMLRDQEEQQLPLLAGAA